MLYGNLIAELVAKAFVKMNIQKLMRLGPLFKKLDRSHDLSSYLKTHYP
jgi:hypothetical protein